MNKNQISLGVGILIGFSLFLFWFFYRFKLVIDINAESDIPTSETMDGMIEEVMDEVNEGIQLVQPTLRPYFVRFNEEARRRGLDIDAFAFGIEAEVAPIERDVVGSCYRTHAQGDPKYLVVNTSRWNTADDFIKELIVFHELGHCIGDLEHDDRKLNGRCSSIMNSGKAGCFFVYNSSTRKGYLDQFFDSMLAGRFGSSFQA